MEKMTLNEALKTRALVAKRISHAETRVENFCAHTSLTKPILGENQTEILKRTMQSIEDLRKYQAQLQAAISKANLKTRVQVKGLGEISLYEALELRGHGSGKHGLLAAKMDFLQQVARKIDRANQEAESVVRSLPKETRDVSVILHVDPKMIENEIAKGTQLQHDLDVAIEATNFTTDVDLEPLAPEKALT